MRKLYFTLILTASLIIAAEVPVRAGGILVWDELAWTQDLLHAIRDYATQIRQWTVELKQLENDLMESTGLADLAVLKQEVESLGWEARSTYYSTLGLVSSGGGLTKYVEPYYWEHWRAPYTAAENQDRLAPIIDGTAIDDLNRVVEPDQRAYERELEMLRYRGNARELAEQRQSELRELGNRALGDPAQTEKEALQVANAQQQLALQQAEQLQSTLDALLGLQNETERREMEARRIAADEADRKFRETQSLAMLNPVDVMAGRLP